MPLHHNLLHHLTMFHLLIYMSTHPHMDLQILHYHQPLHMSQLQHHFQIIQLDHHHFHQGNLIQQVLKYQIQRNNLQNNQQRKILNLIQIQLCILKYHLQHLLNLKEYIQPHQIRHHCQLHLGQIHLNQRYQKLQLSVLPYHQFHYNQYYQDLQQVPIHINLVSLEVTEQKLFEDRNSFHHLLWHLDYNLKLQYQYNRL